MSDAEWPAPEPATPREPERRTTPLPRVEDLPIAEQGYDREKVREAFDAFYRHAAQLDATLSTLEAVEVFQRDLCRAPRRAAEHPRLRLDGAVVAGRDGVRRRWVARPRERVDVAAVLPPACAWSSAF